MVESIQDYGIFLLVTQGRVWTWAKTLNGSRDTTLTADGLIRAIEAVQLLGANVIHAGISAVMTDTFVGIDPGFSPIKTTADL